MTVTVGAVIGLVLGLTGAGGSIFAVPLFVVLLGLSLNDAMGISLGAVSAAAAAGVLLRNNSRELAWLPGLILATAGMITAPLGRWLGMQTHELVLLAVFSLLASSLAVRMWVQANTTRNGIDKPCAASAKPEDPQRLRLGKPIQLIFAGLFCGLLSGFLGIGGGFIIVPLLTLYAGMDVRRAVNTSLFVIALISTAGFAFHVLEVSAIPSDRLLQTCLGSVLGVALGTLIAKRMAGPTMQKLFAGSVIGLVALTLIRTIT